MVEVVVAIAILGLVTAPICSNMMVAARLNAKSRAMLAAQLRVSSAVERLMAEGIEEEGEVGSKTIVDPDFPGVNVEKWSRMGNEGNTITDHKEAVYCRVVVSSEDGLVVAESVVKIKETGGESE